jgi:hypothetical protein
VHLLNRKLCPEIQSGYFYFDVGQPQKESVITWSYRWQSEFTQLVKRRRSCLHFAFELNLSAGAIFRQYLTRYNPSIIFLFGYAQINIVPLGRVEQLTRTGLS